MCVREIETAKVSTFLFERKQRAFPNLKRLTSALTLRPGSVIRPGVTSVWSSAAVSGSRLPCEVDGTLITACERGAGSAELARLDELWARAPSLLLTPLCGLAALLSDRHRDTDRLPELRFRLSARVLDGSPEEFFTPALARCADRVVSG